MSSKLSTSNSQFVSFQQVLQFSLPPKRTKKINSKHFAVQESPHDFSPLSTRHESSAIKCTHQGRRVRFFNDDRFSLQSRLRHSACEYVSGQMLIAAKQLEQINHMESLFFSAASKSTLPTSRQYVVLFSLLPTFESYQSIKRMHKRHNTKPISEKGADRHSLAAGNTRGPGWRYLANRNLHLATIERRAASSKTTRTELRVLDADSIRAKTGW